MLDLVALPKRYLGKLGNDRVAEIVGVSTSILGTWIKREIFPLDALQKLLDFDPSPIHEIQPFYVNPVKHPKLSVIVPSSSPPHLNTTKCLLKMMDADMSLEPETFNSLYHVRNMAAARFLRSSAEWSFWSDSDMIHPCGDAYWFKSATRRPNYPDVFAGLNTIYRLLAHKKTFVSCCYIAKQKGGPVQFQGGDDASMKQMIARGPQQRIVQADWCGFGGVLVHRKVFEDVAKGGHAPKLTNAYMRNRMGYEWGFFNPVEEHFGDDISFCVRAKRAGHDLSVDLAVMSEHIGSHCFGYEDLR